MSYDFSVTATTVTVGVTPVEGYDEYRVFFRLESESNAERRDFTATTTEKVYITFENLTPSTLYAVNVIYSKDGWTTYETMGLETVLTDDIKYRPSDWVWTSIIASGKDISITATEWNDFCSRINEFRDYDDLSPYNFDTVLKGDEISAVICNQACDAINDITGHGVLPSSVSKGDEIYAGFFTGLRDALNAVS